jgi:hypothetical protein
MIWLLLLPWIALTAHTAVNAALLRRLDEPTGETTEKVAVLLPLRNEADRVTPCLEALLAQRHVPNLTIHVLDDHSTDASRQATCRMYTSWTDLTAGYTKSLWASFGSGPAAALVVVLLLFLYGLPPAATPILAVTGFSRASLVALCAYVLAVAGRVVTAHATGGRAWPDALAHPVSVVLFAWLTARSFALRRRGALTWRGRSV